MNLHRSYCALGHQSVVALGRKVLGMSTVEVIPNDECRNVWVKTWASMLRRHDDGARQVRGAGRILRRNLLLYGVGGVIIPFIGIKAIDLLLHAVHLA